ncbi:MAG TPA: phospholipase D-like domain-containing protein [Chitinophagaceae bacterium]|nr:phospholipase D-like domain-containing protein [Chitinophagaceae bacterium]
MAEQYTYRNRISLVQSGEDYFSLLGKLIEQASHTIHLQTYIYDNDEKGRKIGDALKVAAKRGVAVYLHVDGYASQRLAKHFRKEMEEAGVHFKFFAPLLKSRHFYFGRRLHQKVFVVDGLFSLVGGLNISNRYNNMPDQQAWFDLALYCEGEASYQLHLICNQMWRKRRGLKDNIEKKEVELFCDSIDKEERQLIRVRQNDWVKRKSEVWNSYRQLLSQSQETITVMSSYFLPGRTFRRLLGKAVKRGVNVKVILAGKSDVPLSKNAERYLYDYLLRKQIQIYEYQKTVLHAKISVGDNELVTIGSFNVNNISAYASLELNLDIKSKLFGSHVQEEINKVISNDCLQITTENYTSSTNVFRKLWQKVSYMMVNWILTLFTFYFKQED